MRYRRVGYRNKKIMVAVFCIAMLVLMLTGIILFKKNHFAKNTVIQNVDCSYLTIEEAKNQINKALYNYQIILIFDEGKEYKISGRDLAFQIKDTNILETILQKQFQDFFVTTSENYTIDKTYFFNEEKLKAYLRTLPELQKENQIRAQNAYMEWDELQKKVVIIPEIYGFEINIETATEFVKKQVIGEKNYIDFTVFKTTPDIKTHELQTKVDELNDILSTAIDFTFNNDIAHAFSRLDVNTMKNWIFKDEQGNYQIEIHENLKTFVENLNKQAYQQTFYMEFDTSSGEKISFLLAPSMLRGNEQEEQTKQILELLGTAKSHVCSFFTTQLPINGQLTDYIELDITKQTIWMYRNGQCILETPCVTGSVADGHSTPTGIYFLSYKTTNVTLRGYNNDGSRYASPVDYWMPFNGAIGFHDASWRNGIFGGEIYKTDGSHGCVNMPYDAAKTLYENIDSSIPIIIYKS